MSEYLPQYPVLQGEFQKSYFIFEETKFVSCDVGTPFKISIVIIYKEGEMVLPSLYFLLIPFHIPNQYSILFFPDLDTSPSAPFPWILLVKSTHWHVWMSFVREIQCTGEK